MAGGQQLPEQYTVPQYARIFHSLPHLNVSLHSVNNTFNPHSEIYLEVGMVLPDIEVLDLIFSRNFIIGDLLSNITLFQFPNGTPFRARTDLVDLKQSASPISRPLAT